MRASAKGKSVPTIAAGGQADAVAQARPGPVVKPVINSRFDAKPGQPEPGLPAIARGEPASTEPEIKPVKGVLGLNRGLQRLELFLAEAGSAGLIASDSLPDLPSGDRA